MLNPTLHVLLVSAQAGDIGEYITLSFTTPLRLQRNCRDWTHYSSRQRQKMTLGGVVGEWRLKTRWASSPTSKKMKLPPCAVQRNKLSQ